MDERSGYDRLSVDDRLGERNHGVEDAPIQSFWKPLLEFIDYTNVFDLLYVLLRYQISKSYYEKMSSSY